ncbi:hypothetical protein R5S71_004659 [Salmonella enterica]|nr:hypothetical protein [Salmonella enterica]EEM8545022.1 hypothetical protein [Salmonella enterica]EGL8404429.1 hypothetical protein [Salmonella enterica]EGL8486901.1 hypothetical protein [Salmonella enterica]EGL8496541.1 hypothetical protein [Salmonella enterica]
MKENTSRKAPLLLRIDASDVTSKIGELVDLFESERPFIKGASDDIVDLFFHHIHPLIDDITLCNYLPTDGTTNPDEICLKVKIVRPFDHFAAAIRAGDLHSLAFSYNGR